MSDTGTNRDVVGVVAASHFVNHTYLMLLPAVVASAASSVGVSLAAVGLAVSAQGVAMAAFQLPFGYLADARSRELVLGICLVLGAVGAGLVALAPSLAWLVVGEAVLGVGVAGHHPAHYPMLGDAVASERRGRAFSVHGFAGNVGFAAPFALAPLVVSLGGTWRTYAGLVAVAGLAFAAAAMVFVRTRVPERVRVPAGDADDAFADRVRAMVRGVGDPAILSLAVLAALAAGSGWVIRTYTASLLGGAYGYPGGTASLLVSAMIGIAAVVVLGGGVLADRVRPGGVLVAGFLVLAAFSVVLAGGWLPAVLAAGLVLVYNAAMSVTTPSRSKLTDRLSARGDVGKNFALVTIGISAGTTVAPPVAGYLVGAHGPGLAFDGVAVAAVCAAGVAGLVASRYAGATDTTRE